MAITQNCVLRCIGDFDLGEILNKINCSVLLLQADASLGGMMTDRSVDHALSKLKKGYLVRIEHAGHNLGLDRWKVAPLHRPVMAFLDMIHPQI
jgi:pimeloyl-ACP methyl ester carboxylesterase